MATVHNFSQPPEGSPRYTGRQLVMVDAGATHKTILSKAGKASLKLASFKDYCKKDSPDFQKAFEEADGIVFEQCGVAVINEGKEAQISRLLEAADSKKTFYYSEPERYVYALSDSLEDFMSGYKSAAEDIYNRIKAKNNGLAEEEEDTYLDDDKASWGIHAVGALDSKYTGKGTKVAILDTGFYLEHPDFVTRKIISKSFVKGQEVKDLNGHGTHCTGISTGDINKKTGRRYGVAKEAEIFVGKVLSNAGSGTDSSILAGIDWAMSNKCNVISMSLGAPVQPGETYSKIYNDVAEKALNNGTLIIAAAGNDSRRDLGKIAPVGHPANCPAIMAVAALDNHLAVAYFSSGGINKDGGQIDVAAPGVNVYSSWKAPDDYNTISGTSMATPFVAGSAALFWEKNPKASASDIWMYLTQQARRLDQKATDVGSGLVQVPK